MTTDFPAYLILPNTFEKLPFLINSEIQTIKDLMKYIEEEFEIKNKFTLHINECVLPYAESIDIVKESEVITVKTESAPYLAFMPEIRIKLNLSSYYYSWNKYGYMLIPPNTKTVADLINCISKLYGINTNFTLRLNHEQKDLEYICKIRNEDVVHLIPEKNPYEIDS